MPARSGQAALETRRLTSRFIPSYAAIMRTPLPKDPNFRCDFATSLKNQGPKWVITMVEVKRRKNFTRSGMPLWPKGWPDTGSAGVEDKQRESPSIEGK